MSSDDDDSPFDDFMKRLDNAIVQKTTTALKDLFFHRRKQGKPGDFRSCLQSANIEGRTTLLHACFKCNKVSFEMFETLLSEIEATGGASLLRKLLSDDNAWGEKGWSCLMYLTRYSSDARIIPLFIDAMRSVNEHENNEKKDEFLLEQVNHRYIQAGYGYYNGPGMDRYTRTVFSCLTAASLNSKLDSASLALVLGIMFKNNTFRTRFCEINDEKCKERLLRMHSVDGSWSPNGHDFRILLRAIQSNDQQMFTQTLKQSEDPGTLIRFKADGDGLLSKAIENCLHGMKNTTLGFLMDEIHRVGYEYELKLQLLHRIEKSGKSSLAMLLSLDKPQRHELIKTFFVKILQYLDRPFLKQVLLERSSSSSSARGLLSECVARQGIESRTIELICCLLTSVGEFNNQLSLLRHSEEEDDLLKKHGISTSTSTSKEWNHSHLSEMKAQVVKK